MNRTLYVSDLDGTLLRRDKTISTYTADIINRLSVQGDLFSYATARSIYTAGKLTAGITAALPVVTYNGGILLNSRSGKILQANFFPAKETAVIGERFLRAGLSPLVYAYVNGKERLSYCPDTLSAPAREFLADRPGDRRLRPVASWEELLAGKVFYFNCIDQLERLRGLYAEMREQYLCLFQRDLYCDGYTLEIMPRNTSKAEGIQQLKALLGCSRVVAFGDGVNDIPMFKAADECYAVENAAPELKAIATGVIGSNEADGVAQWLAAHVLREQP